MFSHSMAEKLSEPTDWKACSRVGVPSCDLSTLEMEEQNSNMQF